jgi:hypothetical protein
VARTAVTVARTTPASAPTVWKKSGRRYHECGLLRDYAHKGEFRPTVPTPATREDFTGVVAQRHHVASGGLHKERPVSYSRCVWLHQPAALWITLTPSVCTSYSAINWKGLVAASSPNRSDDQVAAKALLHARSATTPARSANTPARRLQIRGATKARVASAVITGIYPACIVHGW